MPFYPPTSADADARRFHTPTTRLTRVHFRIVAAALADARPPICPMLAVHSVGADCTDCGTRRGWWQTCRTVASHLADHNPNFDRARFLMWCGE